MFIYINLQDNDIMMTKGVTKSVARGLPTEI